MAVDPRRPPTSRYQLLYVGLALVLAVPATGCGRGRPDQGRERAPLSVQTQTVAIARFSNVVDTTSTLEALDAVQLAAQAGGRLERLLVRQGDQVRAGQLLLVLDQAQARADVARLRAAVATNRLNWQRYDDLVNQGAASAIQRDEFRQIYIASREQLVASEADLAFRDLRAPIDGTIGDVRVKVGDVISAGSPFASIIRNNQLLARVEVPAIFANRVRLGQTVILLDPSTGTPLAEAPVRAIDPVVSSGTQSLLVKAAFNNPHLRLRAGLRIRARLVLDSREHPFVPFVAVTQRADRRFVYQVGTLAQLRRKPGRVDLKPLAQRPPTTPVALQTPVQLGALENNRYPVFKGLDPGRRVITSNLINLRDGMPIQPQP